MTGRRGTAPCGHPGTYVIGQYVTCSVRCHAPPPARKRLGEVRVYNRLIGLLERRDWFGEDVLVFKFERTPSGVELKGADITIDRIEVENEHGTATHYPSYRVLGGDDFHLTIKRPD